MNTSQDIKRHNVVQNDGNEYGNGNGVTTLVEGNNNGINGNLIRCYNCRGEGHYGGNCTESKVNFTLEDTLQQESTSGTQSDNAPVYDSDRSAEVPKDENCYDHDIFNMFIQEVQYTNLQTELDRTKQKT
nr:hypothetical protein [Tanacetum cinerariifolium]